MLEIMRDFRENLNALKTVWLKGKCLASVVRGDEERRTMIPNMIGAYGPWAAGLAGDGPARLSFRNPRFQPGDLDAWRSQARGRLQDRLLQPDSGGIPQAQLQHQLVHDGLHVEHLTWQLPYGPPTEAYFLKPKTPAGGFPPCSACTITAGTSTSALARSRRSAINFIR